MLFAIWFFVFSFIASSNNAFGISRTSMGPIFRQILKRSDTLKREYNATNTSSILNNGTNELTSDRNKYKAEVVVIPTNESLYTRRDMSLMTYSHKQMWSYSGSGDFPNDQNIKDTTTTTTTTTTFSNFANETRNYFIEVIKSTPIPPYLVTDFPAGYHKINTSVRSTLFSTNKTKPTFLSIDSTDHGLVSQEKSKLNESDLFTSVTSLKANTLEIPDSFTNKQLLLTTNRTMTTQKRITFQENRVNQFQVNVDSTSTHSTSSKKTQFLDLLRTLNGYSQQNNIERNLLINEYDFFQENLITMPASVTTISSPYSITSINYVLCDETLIKQTDCKRPRNIISQPFQLKLPNNEKIIEQTIRISFQLKKIINNHVTTKRRQKRISCHVIKTIVETLKKSVANITGIYRFETFVCFVSSNCWARIGIDLSVNFGIGEKNKTSFIAKILDNFIKAKIFQQRIVISTSSLTTEADEDELRTICTAISCNYDSKCVVKDPYSKKWVECVSTPCSEANYCLNHGICKLNRKGKNQCWCPSGTTWWYRGPRCEIFESYLIIGSIAAGCSSVVLVTIIFVIIGMAKKIAITKQKLKTKRRQCYLKNQYNTSTSVVTTKPPTSRLPDHTVNQYSTQRTWIPTIFYVTKKYDMLPEKRGSNKMVQAIAYRCTGHVTRMTDSRRKVQDETSQSRNNKQNRT